LHNIIKSTSIKGTVFDVVRDKHNFIYSTVEAVKKWFSLEWKILGKAGDYL